MTGALSCYQPTPNDRELSAQAVREVVREQFPDLAGVTIEPLGEGWEHESYLVDDRVVFRFPRRADCGDEFEWEEGLHALAASVVGDIAAIPRITRWGRPSARFPHRFAGHDVIPGVGANDARVPLNPALADDLGRVLARLHSISPEVAVAAGALPADANKVDMTAGVQRIRRVVNELPEVRRLVPSACAWLDDIARPVEPYRGPPRFIHDDFQPEHIIVDPATGRLSGIIDWGGGLGDPLRDLGYVLLLGGWSFLHRALGVYDVPLDVEFMERARFSARLGAIDWLGFAVSRGLDPASEVARVHRVFEMG